MDFRWLLGTVLGVEEGRHLSCATRGGDARYVWLLEYQEGRIVNRVTKSLGHKSVLKQVKPVNYPRLYLISYKS